MITWLANFFVNPLVFTTGAIAASIPIIIHLLNRRRFKIREWAAMKFLLESVRKNRRRVQIEEIILLVLRTLALILLALAIARFTGCGQSAGGGGIISKGATTVIYVLDDSPSMSQRIGGSTMFSAAAADLVDLIKKVPQGDKVGILLTSQGAGEGAGDASGATSKPEGHAFQDPDFLNGSKMADDLAARVQALKPTGKHSRLADSLSAAEAILVKDNSPNKQLVILSDFRKVDLGKEQTGPIRKKFSDLQKENVKVVTMDYGRDCKRNLTIESFRLMDKFSLAKQAANVRLTVRNNSDTPADNCEIKLRIVYPKDPGTGDDKSQVAKQAVASQMIKQIDPGESRSVDFQVTPPAAGSSVVVAELATDEMPADDIAYLALDARDVLRVLAIDGDFDAADTSNRQSYYLDYALNPRHDKVYGNHVDVIGPEGLNTVRLEEYDLVAMLNVPSFPAAATEEGGTLYPQLVALENYVRNGGGLMIFTGDKVNLDFYGPTDPNGARGRFFKGGEGLLPLPLSAQMGDPADTSKFFHLDAKSLSADNCLKTLVRYRNEGVDATMLVRFFAFNPAVEAAAPASADVKPARVLARFADPKSSPAIVAKEFGKGSVLMVCTACAGTWHDWFTDPIGTYVPFINDMATYLARASRAEMTGVVGDSITYEVPFRYRDAKASLQRVYAREDEEVAEDEVTLGKQADKPNSLRYDQAVQAGVYKITLLNPDKARKDVLFAQNVDPLEGQLAAGHKPEISSTFNAGDKDYEYVDRTGAATSASAATGPQKEYWMLALAGLLLLLATETFLAQKFGHYA